ncbi:MAG TPA: 3',5'-cyclic-nucleotide phosphodiesterase [Planctomycetes bacterium]|nr:3',5'-cyclic-nucleotide phosphodiesterase [Fuerstiella sp.]HIK92917.1 3',5'-cyclic-nucleotide phosphodiesterase [Planctomycetota bacterium]
MHRSQPLARILHLSDLHFGPPFIAEVGQAVLRIAHHLNIDAIVVSGDFTQRAKEEQFQAAREFLDRLPDVPRLYVPGNHDVPLCRIRERFLDSHGLYRKYISPEINPVLSMDHAVIVGIDSSSPRTAITNGRIHQWQLETAEQVFAEAPVDAARIVVAHHHFAPAPDNLYDRTMPKAKRAIMRFVEDDVDMILGGHLHRAYIGNTLDVYSGVHRERGIVIVQSGTTTSRRGRGREREKNSFNVIDFNSDTMKITHYLYFDSDAGFVPASRHLFPRGLLPLPPDSASDSDRTSAV